MGRHRLGMATLRIALTYALLLRPTIGLRTVVLNSGQALVDAVAAFGSDGEDTTLLLPRGRVVSLGGVRLPNAQPPPGYTPFSSGTLTFAPAPGTGAAVLDTAMLVSIARYNNKSTVFTGNARIVFREITLVNNCDINIVVDGNIGLSFDTAFPAPFLLSGLYFQVYTITDSVVYLRHADITQWMSAINMFKSPFPQISGQLQSLEGVVQPLVVTRLTTAYSVTFDAFNFPTFTSTNLTVMSVANPGDPLLQTLRANNRLLSPRLCEGTPGAPPPLMVNSLVPLWITSDAMSWADALYQATSQMYLGTALGVPVTVVLTGIASLGGLQRLPALTPVSYNVLLSGPIVYGPRVAAEGVLDLEGVSGPVLSMAASGQLFLQYLRLRNLPARPLNTSGTPSVFPLSSFPITSATNVIQVYNVTLELPDLDYLALMTLAQPDLATQVNATVQAHAAALKGGISAMTIQSVSPGLVAVRLANMTGWGLNATNLNLVPSSPVAVVPLAAAQALATAATSRTATHTGESNGDVNRSQSRLAIIIGATVGGVMALAAATVWGLVCLRRLDRCKAAAGAAQPSEEPDSNGVTVKVDPSPRGIGQSFQGTDAAPKSLQPTAGQAIKAATYGASRSSESPTCASSSTGHGLTFLETGTTHSTAEEHNSSATAAATPSAQAQGAADAAGAAHPDVQSLLPGGPHSYLAQRDIEKLETFCSELVAVEHNQGGATAVQLEKHRAGAGLDAQAPQVTLVFRRSRPMWTGPPAAQHAAEAGSAGSSLVRSSVEATEGGPAVVTAGPVLRVHGAEVGPPVAGCAGLGEGMGLAAEVGSVTPTDPRELVGQLLNEMQSDFNKVDVTGVLGQGSWGTVYSGRWRGLDIALKTITFEVHEGAETETGHRKTDRQQQAVTEAAVAASVDHPNVVRTYYYDIQSLNTREGRAQNGLQIDDQAAQHKEGFRTYKLFLVQERCTTSLAHITQTRVLMNPQGQVQVDAIRLLLLDIAKGLEYLHGRNIVHGDLKPANVLLILSGKSLSGVAAKLADFGLSARLTMDATHISNYMCGTPFYVAPEVVEHHRTSPASDIFSFGIIMWQLYTGETPYMVQVQGPMTWNPLFPLFPPTRTPPQSYFMLTQRCLRRDPKQRPTATEIIQALSSELFQRSPQHPPQSPTPQAKVTHADQPPVHSPERCSAQGRAAQRNAAPQGAAQQVVQEASNKQQLSSSQ